MCLQCLENCEMKGISNTSDPRKKNDERAPEKEEEDYFNEDRYTILLFSHYYKVKHFFLGYFLVINLSHFSDEEDTASVAPKQNVESQPALSNGVTTNCPSVRYFHAISF